MGYASISNLYADQTILLNREGAGEFEPSNQVNAEIGKRTAQLLKQRFAAQLQEKQGAS